MGEHPHIETANSLDQIELRFRLLVSAVKDYAIFMLDSNGYVRTWNDGAQNIKGYQAHEIIGKHFSVFYPEEDIRAGKPIRELQIAASEGVYKEEGERLRKDGTRFFANVTLTALYDADGKLQGFGKVTRDITEKRRTEEALKALTHSLEQRVRQATLELVLKEAQLTLIAHSLPVLIAYIDHNQLYRFNNETYEKWFGKPAKEYLGKAVREVVGEKAYAVLRPHLERSLQDGVTADFETFLDYPRSSRWVHCMYVPDRAEDGTVRGVVALIDDITTRKRHEEELKQHSESLARANAELIASNTELSQFAHVSSHDLKEPLRMVKAYTQLLAQRFDGKLEAEDQQYMAFITEGAARMEALINDLLAYAAVGKVEHSFERVDLNALVDDVVHDLSATIREKNATVSFEKLPTIYGSRNELVQVFQNLIGNGIKFNTSPRPEVRVGVKSENGNWVVSITDNGIGLDPAFASQIFVIFQRLHSRSEYPGTGIGLAICKKVIERHGGKIWVESAPGTGSRFLFTLPKAP